VSALRPVRGLDEYPGARIRKCFRLVRKLDAHSLQMERVQVKGSGQAKFWLSDGRLAKSRGFAEHELREVHRKIEERREDLLRAWHEHFRT
jgi:hypothetical protein